MEKNLTISEGMVLQRTIGQRKNDLQQMRNANLVRSRHFSYLGDGEPKERIETEPQYDPKVVDAKIVELETFLFKLDSSIKRANAKAIIEIEVDVDKLLEPIK
jgi:hypothetical protein